MALEVKWTLPAKVSYENVVAYLEKEWTEREIRNFVNNVEEKLRLISVFPELYFTTNKRKNIHRAVISKQTVLFYRVYKSKNRIELLLFWDTRRNPKNLKL